jgi:hypothetical protein
MCYQNYNRASSQYDNHLATSLIYLWVCSTAEMIINCSIRSWLSVSSTSQLNQTRLSNKFDAVRRTSTYSHHEPNMLRDCPPTEWISNLQQYMAGLRNISLYIQVLLEVPARTPSGNNWPSFLSFFNHSSLRVPVSFNAKSLWGPELLLRQTRLNSRVVCS